VTGLRALNGFVFGFSPAVAGSSGVVAYWSVPDAATELARLTELGAAVHEPLTDVGGGIKVAAVKDPFGNVLGLIENPNFNPAEVR
jgi:predicted enzyme related to lactoylglutathione lyase